MENEVLTAADVAQMLRISNQRVYEITRRKLLPHVKIADRQYRYVKSEIEAWLLNGGNAKVSETQDDERILR